MHTVTLTLDCNIMSIKIIYNATHPRSPWPRCSRRPQLRRHYLGGRPGPPSGRSAGPATPPRAAAGLCENTMIVVVVSMCGDKGSTTPRNKSWLLNSARGTGATHFNQRTYLYIIKTKYSPSGADASPDSTPPLVPPALPAVLALVAVLVLVTALS